MFKIRKNIFRFFIFFLFLFFFYVNLVFSICSYSPSSIEAFYGNQYLGNFSLGDNIFIGSKINNNPISLKLIFEGTDNCFTNNEQVKIKFFSDSANIKIPNNYIPTHTDINFKDEYDFKFQGAYTLASNFDSKIFIYDNISNLKTNGLIHFKIDSNPPIINIDSNFKLNPYYRLGSLISIPFLIKDQSSGLKQLTIINSNSGNNITIFNANNKTFLGNYSFKINSDTKIKILVEDKLGFENQKEFNFTVDSQKPEISLFTPIYKYEGGKRKVGFKFSVSDNSYDVIFPGLNFINLNLSNLNPSLNSINLNVGTDCNKDLINNKKFNCKTHLYDIPFKTSKSIDIRIIAKDYYNNSFEKIYLSNIFVDFKPPEIKEFYLENNLSVKDVFSANDNSSIVYLKFSDDSLGKNYGIDDFSIITKFGKIPFSATNIDLCSQSGKFVTCKWPLFDTVNSLNEVPYGSANFSVKITDVYGNTNIKSFVAKIDNVPPKLEDLDFQETNDIKDNIIQSGEKINFKLKFKDKNPDYNGKYFVKGYFGEFSTDSKYSKLIDGSCIQLNKTTTQCSFDGIVARNGYVNSTVYFQVYDSARNLKKFKLENLKIFKIGNEEKQVFRNNVFFKTLNPINRNSIFSQGKTAWFEGNLEFVDNLNSNNYSLINFQFVGGSDKCNLSSLSPLVVEGDLDGIELYPMDIKYATGNFKEDKKFTIKVPLANYNDFAGSNDKNMTCKISILYHDNNTIYPPEIINISLGFAFYDLPRGEYLRANAMKIYELSNDVNFMDGFFGDLYNFYKIFRDTCSIISSITSTLSTMDTMWVKISLVLHSMGFTEPTANAGDKAISGTHGFLSILNFDKFSYVKKICDFVTCRDGGLVGLYLGSNENAIINSFSKITGQDSAAKFICNTASRLYNSKLKSKTSSEGEN